MKTMKIKKQKGVVLLWSMVILLVLLILSVAAMQMTGLDTRIAGNEMTRMLVFQSAESGIERTANMFRLDQASQAVNRTMTVNNLQDDVDTGGGIQQTLTNSIIALDPDLSRMTCPAMAGLANSFEATSESNQVACQLYTVDSVARLPGTGAMGEHALGLIKIVPAIDGNR
jgi:Tfp pilus assembly protein PilX